MNFFYPLEGAIINISICILIALVPIIYITKGGKRVLHNNRKLHETDRKKTPEKLVLKDHIDLNSFLHLDKMVLGICFTLIVFFLGFYNNLLNAYDNRYAWFHPYDVLRFPIDQLKCLDIEKLKSQRCSLDTFYKDPYKYYNLVLSDFSLSTNSNKESSVYELSKRIQQRLIKESHSAGILEPRLKQNIPLLLFTGFKKADKYQLETKCNYYYYSGFDKFSSLFDSTWEKTTDFTLDIKDNTNDKLITKYYAFLDTSQKNSQNPGIIRKLGHNGRTDFSFIASALSEIFNKEKNENNPSSVYSSLTIISDFLHDDTMPAKTHLSPVPFYKVKRSLNKLFALKNLNQINLLIIPTSFPSPKAELKIKQLLDIFKRSNLNIYECHLDLFDPELNDNIDAPDKILAYTTNYRTGDVDSIPKLYFYYPFGYRTSAKSMFSSMEIDFPYGKETPKLSGNVFMRLRSSIPLAEDFPLEIKVVTKSPENMTIYLNKFHAYIVNPEEKLQCYLNFNGSEPPCNIFLDMYSPEYGIKNTYHIEWLPTLSKTLCYGLIALYSIFISSICICVLFTALEIFRTSSQKFNSSILLTSFLSTVFIHLGLSKIYFIELSGEGFWPLFLILFFLVLNWGIAIHKYRFFVKKIISTTSLISFPGHKT